MFGRVKGMPSKRDVLDKPSVANYESVRNDDEERGSIDEKEHAAHRFLSVSYGLVAAAMCTPVMLSFSSIIFGDPFFKQYMPHLVKLVLFSSSVHQLCYIGGSSLAFAVGQVQDAGLIFLSAMARTMVLESRQDSLSESRGGIHGGGFVGEVSVSPETVSDEATVAAALWTLGIATALLGVMLVLVGKLRLASLAQYLPVPVVGGYLAYIGFYCGQAGLAMMAGVEIVRLSDWRRLATPAALIRVAPGFAVAAAIQLCGSLLKKNASRAVRALVVPTVLCVAILAFYVILFATGMSLSEARAEGWVGAAPANHGASTGTGWRSVACFEPWGLYFPPDVSVLSVLRVVARATPKLVPTWFAMVVVVAFSSSLDVAAIEMELGRPLDYDNELVTVGVGNVVSGALGGFSGSYIFSQTILNMRSNVADRLSGLTVAIIELALVFVFPVPPTAVAPIAAFGGLLLVIAVELMDEWLVRARHKFSPAEYSVALFTFAAIHVLGLEAGFATGLVAATVAFAALYGLSTGAVSCERSSVTRSVVLRDYAQRAFLSTALRRDDVIVLELRGYVFFGAAAALLAQCRQHLGLEKSRIFLGTPSLRGRLPSERPPPSTPCPDRRKFVVIDCRDFTGIDATAARACFVPLRRQLHERQATMLFASVRDAVRRTLDTHGFKLKSRDVFPNLDAALEAAEDRLLGPLRYAPDTPSASLVDVLDNYLRGDDDAARTSLLDNADQLDAYFAHAHIPSGTTLFHAGESPDKIFFVARGVVDFVYGDDNQNPRRRILRVKRGGVCGELNYFLKRPQRFSAKAAADCHVFILSRAKANDMRRGRPDLYVAIQTALLKSLVLQVEDSLGGPPLSGSFVMDEEDDDVTTPPAP